MRAILFAVLLLTACPPSEPTDTGPSTGDPVCSWVEPSLELAGCTVTIDRMPVAEDQTSSIVIAYNEWGLQTSYTVDGELLSADGFDERGRPAFHDTALAANPGVFGALVYSWDGCWAYTTERDADGDGIVDETSDVVLRDNGRVDSRVTTRLTGGLAGQVTAYASEWDDDRIVSSVSTSDGAVSLALEYTYSSDELGEAVTVDFYRANSVFFARSISWTDALGRETRSEGFGADERPNSLRITAYDGPGVDATQTLEVDNGADGTVDTTKVTYFLPDGRIDRDETTTQDSTWSRSYSWDCP